MSRNVQTQIWVEDSPQVDELCRWCNAPAKEQIVLEPERYRYIEKAGQRIKEMSKRAITAGVCGDCKNHMILRKTDKPDTYKVKGTK